MNHHIGEYDPAAANMEIFQHPRQQHFHHDSHSITSPTDRDVINGRGKGVLRHPGNAKYRKLVSVNKIIYAKCSTTDKMKISKGIVDAVRELGGSFLELDKLTGLYHDIGDKKAKEKTSQALREGQTSIRKGLHQNGEMPNTSQQKQTSAAVYFGSSVKVLELLWKADENDPYMKGAAPSPPSPSAIPAEAVTKPVIPPAPVPEAVLSTSTIDPVNFCSSDQDKFAGVVQTVRNEARSVTMKASKVRGARHDMQHACGEQSFKAEDLKPSMMPSNQPQLSHAMPPLPPAIPDQAISDDSCPSIRPTNTSLGIKSSAAHILAFMHNSNEARTSENVSGTIKSAMCEIDHLRRLSEQKITKVLSMTAEEMKETVKLEDEQVALKDEENASQHNIKEVALSDENNMMDHRLKLRFPEEDCAKPANSPLFTDNMRFTKSSRLMNYSMHHRKNLGASTESGDVNSTRDMTTTNLFSEGKDAFMKVVMAKQREWMDSFSHQQRVSDTETQLILLGDQIHRARADISKRIDAAIMSHKEHKDYLASGEDDDIMLAMYKEKAEHDRSSITDSKKALVNLEHHISEKQHFLHTLKTANSNPTAVIATTIPSKWKTNSSEKKKKDVEMADQYGNDNLDLNGIDENDAIEISKLVELSGWPSKPRLDNTRKDVTTTSPICRKRSETDC